MLPNRLIGDLLFVLRGDAAAQLPAHQTEAWHQLFEETKAGEIDTQAQFTPPQSG